MSHSSHLSKYTRHYRPQHPLAQYIVNQINTLELRAPDIIRAMGYPLGHTIPACERLRHVLCHRHLGLDNSYMDRYFSADAFLATLFEILELPYEPFAEDIAQIKAQVAQRSDSLLHYRLRAQVDFAFVEGANWLSRWGAALAAEVHLPSGFVTLDERERKAAIKQSIREHYRQFDGHLPYNGVIQGYQLMVLQQDEVIEKVAYGLPTSSSV
ncbi:hypothetical protein ACTXMK_04835 [Psychrobacter celer]|uniref:hypothetical protein n=1 Tax=Psychrobacter celer TaxID=306572 RepID=UPI003FD4CFB5